MLTSSRHSGSRRARPPPGVTLPPTMLGGLATRMDTDDSDSLATDQDTPRSPKGKKRMRDDQEDDYVDLLSNRGP